MSAMLNPSLGGEVVAMTPGAVAWPGLVRSYLGKRVARQNLARASWVEYRYVLRDFAEGMEGVPFRGDMDTIVAGVDAWLAAHRWSTATICTNLGIVRPFLVWCATSTTGHAVPHGAAAASQLHNPRRAKPLPRAFSRANMSRLLAVVPDARGRVIVLLEGQCGLRRAEVAGVMWPADVDLAEGAIRVRGKGRVERMVYPSEETMDAIRALLVERGPGPGHLICRYDRPGAGITPTWIGLLVAGWMRDADLKLAPHDGVSGHALRHTAATQLLRDGANIMVVKEALGHENVTTTARYLRVDNPEVKAAMAKLNYGSRRLRVVSDD